MHVIILSISGFVDGGIAMLDNCWLLAKAQNLSRIGHYEVVVPMQFMYGMPWGLWILYLSMC